MKLGTEDKTKTYVAIALFALAVFMVIYTLWPSASPTPVAQDAATASGSAAAAAKGQRSAPVFSKLDPSLRLDLLKGSEEVAYKGSGRDIFHAQGEQKAADVGKAPDPRVTKTPVQTGPPPNPPIPLKFYGFASADNKKQIFLSQGEDIFVAREGDIVKGRYKVMHVNANNVEIQDVLGNYSQSIPLSIPNS